MPVGVMLRLQGGHGLIRVAAQSLRVVLTKRGGRGGSEEPSGRKHDLHVRRKWPGW